MSCARPADVRPKLVRRQRASGPSRSHRAQRDRWMGQAPLHLASQRASTCLSEIQGDIVTAPTCSSVAELNTPCGACSDQCQPNRLANLNET